MLRTLVRSMPDLGEGSPWQVRSTAARAIAASRQTLDGDEAWLKSRIESLRAAELMLKEAFWRVLDSTSNFQPPTSKESGSK